MPPIGNKVNHTLLTQIFQTMVELHRIIILLSGDITLKITLCDLPNR